MPRSPSGSKSSPDAVEHLDETLRIVRLRKAGLSLYEIAEETGLAFRQVRSLLHQAINGLELIKVEEANELRLLENERLDTMLASIWERAASGSLYHIGTVLKIMERRAKMLALDLKPEMSMQFDNAMIVPEWAYRRGEQATQLLAEKEAERLIEAPAGSLPALDELVEAPESPSETNGASAGPTMPPEEDAP